jgi:hypothetical protein
LDDTANKYSQPNRQWVPIYSPETFSVCDVAGGILFLMAFWSGPARVSFQVLNEALDRCRVGGLSLFVVDVDTLTAEFCRSQLPPTPVLGGWGETYWILNGKVIYSLAGYTKEHSRTLAEYTQAIAQPGSAG